MFKYIVLNGEYICIGIFSHDWFTWVSAGSASFRKSCWSMFSMKWPISISSVLVLLHYCVRTNKTLGDKLSPLGKFFYLRFSIFSMEYILKNPVWWEKHIYVNTWFYYLGYRYCRHMDYFTKCIYPVLNINWPQVHGLGLNWHDQFITIFLWENRSNSVKKPFHC